MYARISMNNPSHIGYSYDHREAIIHRHVIRIVEITPVSFRSEYIITNDRILKSDYYAIFLNIVVLSHVYDPFFDSKLKSY